MRLRQARKILKMSGYGWEWEGKWIPFYPITKEHIAERRISKYEKNSPKGKIMRDSLRLVRLLAAHPERKEAICEFWMGLRERIVQHWNPEQWGDKRYLDGIRDWKAHDTVVVEGEPNFRLPTVRLEYDISYYSDRWCDRRVAFVDKTIEQMMEG